MVLIISYQYTQLECSHLGIESTHLLISRHADVVLNRMRHSIEPCAASLTINTVWCAPEMLQFPASPPPPSVIGCIAVAKVDIVDVGYIEGEAAISRGGCSANTVGAAPTNILPGNSPGALPLIRWTDETGGFDQLHRHTSQRAVLIRGEAFGITEVDGGAVGVLLPVVSVIIIIIVIVVTAATLLPSLLDETVVPKLFLLEALPATIQ